MLTWRFFCHIELEFEEDENLKKFKKKRRRREEPIEEEEEQRNPGEHKKSSFKYSIFHVDFFSHQIVIT